MRNGVIGEEVISPGQLVELCLKGGSRELILGAFQVFRSAGSKFCTSNHSLLEEAWLRAVDQDDWLGMKQTSEEEGWSDEHILQVLQESLLFQASKLCYGGAHATPLLLSDIAKGVNNFATEVSLETVEAVLSTHPNFSEAGQAMLTAFKLGISSGATPLEPEVDQMVEM